MVSTTASHTSRRALLQATAATALASAAAIGRSAVTTQTVKNGRIRQSICRWCFQDTDLEDLAEVAASMGMAGLDLLTPDQFPVLKKHNLVCTMTKTHGITKGLNDPAYHESCLRTIHSAIEANASAGFRNVICFSGNRNGMDDRVGLKNCVIALKKILPVAEKAGVIVNMELLNSRVDHHDYMCDRSEWGIELVKQVASNNFKLLYDIYHMQIMEGDVMRSIQDNHMYFGHYHTAGNPGRHELDDQQELNYPAICRAIVETGYDGYLGQEFLPTRDPMTSLAEAVELCDV
ncbi:MAG: TIM barrel protein [Planctomycetaceae bacterium]